MSQDNAGQEPVKKPETEVEIKQPNASEVDPEAVISQLLDENKRLEQDRDNYRKGLLKAKGKLQETEEEPEEDIDTKIDRKVQERLAQTTYADSQKRLAEEALKLARENKELKKSLANRGQLSSKGQGGGSQVEVPVGQNYFSPEKIQALKARGWGDDKIERFKQNREKAKGGGI